MVSSTVIPQMGSLVTDFDSFMVMFLSWLLSLSLSFDSGFTWFRVNQEFLFPFFLRAPGDGRFENGREYS